MKKPTKLQEATRIRNFSIMVLRGMWGQVSRLERNHPELKLLCKEFTITIDHCLIRLGANTQKVHRERPWRPRKT